MVGGRGEGRWSPLDTHTLEHPDGVSELGSDAISSGVGAMADEPPGQAKHRRGMAVIQLSECVGITGANARSESGVGRIRR